MDPINFSPDGEHFFFVTRRGDLECDCNVFELTVYTVSDVAQALRNPSDRGSSGVAPLWSISMRHRLPAIGEVAWAEKGAAIHFRGRAEPKSRQLLYRLDVRSGEVETVIDPPPFAELVDYCLVAGGAIYSVRTDHLARIRSRGSCALSPEDVEQLSRTDGQPPFCRFETYVRSTGQLRWKLKSGYVAGGGPWISPDGRHALMVRYPDRIPTEWAHYKKSADTGNPKTQRQFTQFMWIDLENQKETPVFNAPTGQAMQMGAAWEVKALWSEDGRHVVLVNTALPLTTAEHATMAYIVSYEVMTGNWQVLEPLGAASSMRASNVEWLKPGKQFVVQHAQEGSQLVGRIYTYRKSGWVGCNGVPTLNGARAVARGSFPHGVTVEVRQGANDPPIVVASMDGREVALTNPDPALEGVCVARTQRFQWKDAAGVCRTGGLLLPPVVSSLDGKFPLVVQIGKYEPKRFLPDGPDRAGYAAQVLAAKGIAVLNMDSPDVAFPGVTQTKHGLAMFGDWLESAVNALVRRYPVDKDRIALIGFSRAGFLALYAITHLFRFRPAAAVVACSSADPLPWISSRRAAGHDGMQAPDALLEGVLSGFKTLGEEREPIFNVDRVQTPVLFAHYGENLTSWLKTFKALARKLKPFELRVYPADDPMQMTPRQRQHSIADIAEWMALWLKDNEDPGPHRASSIDVGTLCSSNQASRSESQK